MCKMYLHLFLFSIRLYNLPWISVSIISNSYPLIFNNTDTTYSKDITVVIWDLSFSIPSSSTSSFSEPDPSSFSSSLSVSSSSSSTLSSTIFPCFINCVLLEKYDLMVATGRYSPSVKVYLNCFSGCVANNLFPYFLPSSYIL